MRVSALPTILACSLAFATVPQGAFAAAAPTKASKKKRKDKAPQSDGGASVPEPSASERVGRVFIDADQLGDAGPVIAGRSTRVAEGALQAASVTPTDAPAGPELRVVLAYRDSGGYSVQYEIVYDGDVVDDGSGSFECQLCTEDELIEKVEALVQQVAPKMVVPQEEEPVPDEGLDPVPDGPGDGGNGGTKEPIGEDKPGKLTEMGKAGVALLAIGGAALIPGVVLLAWPPEYYPVGHPRAGYVRSTRPEGGAVLGGGVVLVIVGAVLLGIDRKRAKQRKRSAEAAWRPWFDRHGGGMAVTGRF